jgi:formylglycine-generating enzyme required for sulfatase activity
MPTLAGAAIDATIAVMKPAAKPMACVRVLLGLALVVSGCVRFGFDRSPADDAPRSDGPVLADGPAGQDGPFDHDGPPKNDGPKHDGFQPDKTRLDGAPPPPLPSVTINAGKFMMGSPAEEPCRESMIGKKETQHSVTLTRAFELLKTEVTQGQFQTEMGYAPSSFKSCGADCPVETVTWHEAAAFCNALSVKTNQAKCYACSGTGSNVSCAVAAAYSGAKIYTCPGYRLPTEAEWEYAYRAGTTTALYNGPITSCSGSDPGAGAIGWYTWNAGFKPHPVASKKANDWGLYDMAGNVWEWCHDLYQIDLGSGPQTDPWGPTLGASRAGRGGSWINNAGGLRAAGRGLWPPGTPSNFLGFRCARTK